MVRHVRPEFVFLSQSDILATGVGMVEALEETEKVLRLHGEGLVNLPAKVVLDLGEMERGRINALPAHVGGEYDACGVKWVAGFPKNPAKYGIPRANAIIVLNDSWTGMPLAVMDGTYISAMRTGAVTGVGAKYLARLNSSVVAMIGNGPQAYTQIQALANVLPQLEEVRAYDVSTPVSEKFATFVSNEIGLRGRCMESAREAVTGADVIVTVTVADEPIVKQNWLKRGYYFAHVGSNQEEEEEVILKASKIVVDDWESVLHRVTPSLAQMYMGGRLQKDSIYADIGEIIGGVKAGRETDDEDIFFSPIGMGSEDIALAHRVYCAAKAKGLGVSLSLWDGEPAFKGVTA